MQLWRVYPNSERLTIESSYFLSLLMNPPVVDQRRHIHLRGQLRPAVTLAHKSTSSGVLRGRVGIHFLRTVVVEFVKNSSGVLLQLQTGYTTSCQEMRCYFRVVSLGK
jgi:hypothetical protein